MTEAASRLKASLQLRRGTDSRIGEERIRLLEAIGTYGSIRAAAKVVGLSYKGAWDAVQALNNLFDQPLVEAHPGGRSGGVARITPQGEALVATFGRVEAELQALGERLDAELSHGPLDQLWRLHLRTSARNALHGVVTEVVPGAVNATVRLAVSPSVEITALVTCDSVRALGLAPGRQATALIKASFIVLAQGGAPVRASARNCLPGVVVAHEKGAVNDEVVLDIAPGKTLAATITRESADELGVAPGLALQALIKASHVILAVD